MENFNFCAVSSSKYSSMLKAFLFTYSGKIISFFQLFEIRGHLGLQQLCSKCFHPFTYQIQQLWTEQMIFTRIKVDGDRVFLEYSLLTYFVISFLQASLNIEITPSLDGESILLGCSLSFGIVAAISVETFTPLMVVCAFALVISGDNQDNQKITFVARSILNYWIKMDKVVIRSSDHSSLRN